MDRVSEGFHVNWLTSQEMPDERPFVKFAHVPHFSLLGEEGCKKCHKLDKQGDIQPRLPDRGPCQAQIRSQGV